MVDRYVWLWTGILTGIVCMIFLVLLFGSEHSTVDFIYKYQTLIAGLIALFGAWLTYAAVQKQIATSEAAAKEAQARRHSAMRAALPLQASKLHDYFINCLKFFDDLLEHVEGEVIIFPDKFVKTSEFTVPNDVIRFLIDFIEISDPNMQRNIENILLKFQIQNSRMAGIFDKGSSHDVVKQIIFTEIINSAELVKLTEVLFKYARGEDFSYRFISSSYEEINSIIFIYVPRSEIFQSEFEFLIKQRLPDFIVEK